MLTLRQILKALEARHSSQWDHTAAICSFQYNTQMGIKKHQMINPEKIHPYRSRKRRRRGGKLSLTEWASAWGK